MRLDVCRALLWTPGTQSLAIKHYGTRAASKSLCVPLFGLELRRPILETRRGLNYLCHSLKERERDHLTEMLVCRGLVALSASDELHSD